MTITQDWQYDLNGVTFGRGVTPTGFASGTTLSITEISGFDHPDVNSLVSVRSNQHGAYISARYHQHRVWVLTGRLNTSAANYAQDTAVLKRLFRTLSAGLTMPFSFKLPGMAQMVSNVNPAGVKFPVQTIATAVGWVDFTATLLAGDPRIYASASSSSGTKTIAGGAFNLTNNGTEPAPTVITFTGPLNSPVLVNNTTGVQAGLNFNLATGDTFVINSLLQTCTYTPSAGSPVSRFSGVSSVSDWLELAGGFTPTVNNLVLNGTGTGTVALTWNDTWL